MSLIRRPGARFNRGRIQERVGAATTPLTILGSLAWWVRADLGITIGTGVSAWADQSGNGVNFSQGTGAAQPAFIASAVNGQPAVRGDGIDDVLSATWARAAPGTQPFYVWCIFKQVSWVPSDCLLGDFNATGFTIEQVGVSPALIQACSSIGNSNAAGTVGSYFRLESQNTNSVADYLKIGATNVTGTNSGNSAGTGTMQLFALGNGSLIGNFEIAEAFAFLGAPTAPQRAALDAYCTARYGAGLV